MNNLIHHMVMHAQGVPQQCYPCAKQFMDLGLPTFICMYDMNTLCIKEEEEVAGSSLLHRTEAAAAAPVYQFTVVKTITAGQSQENHQVLCQIHWDHFFHCRIVPHQTWPGNPSEFVSCFFVSGRQTSPETRMFADGRMTLVKLSLHVHVLLGVDRSMWSF